MYLGSGGGGGAGGDGAGLRGTWAGRCPGCGSGRRGSSAGWPQPFWGRPGRPTGG
jgi:hypothetical protein